MALTLANSKQFSRKTNLFDFFSSSENEKSHAVSHNEENPSEDFDTTLEQELQWNS